MTDMPRDQFISEPLTPDAGTFDAAAMARGEPGLPQGFVWRKTHYRIIQVLRAWKTCGQDMGEVYLRRHWWQIQTAEGLILTIYCQRQARNGRKRWWVYSQQWGLHHAETRIGC